MCVLGVLFLLGVVSVGLSDVVCLLLFVLGGLTGGRGHSVPPGTLSGELQLAALTRLPRLASAGHLLDDVLLSTHLLNTIYSFTLASCILNKSIHSKLLGWRDSSVTARPEDLSSSPSTHRRQLTSTRNSLQMGVSQS